MHKVHNMFHDFLIGITQPLKVSNDLFGKVANKEMTRIEREAGKKIL